MSSVFRYTEAIVSRIPDAFLSSSRNKSGNGVGGGDGDGPDHHGGSPAGKGNKSGKSKEKENMTTEQIDCEKIDVNKCRAEFEMLVTVMREIGLDVVELPPDESCPMSPFVGDVAFVINGMGVVAKPKSNARQTEVNTIRTVLKKELDIPVIEVDENEACVEGADILFTGRELFVGISNYTNVAGARFVANTFPEYPCSPIKVPGKYHLTHYVNMASPDLICVGAGQDSQDIIKRMEREASFRYQKITVPDDNAANVLFVNGTLVHLTSKEIPQSYKVFADKLTLPRRTVDLTEFSKVSGSFARLVVLLKKSKSKHIICILEF